MLSRIKNYFLTGILILLPLSLTVYIMYYGFILFDGILKEIIRIVLYHIFGWEFFRTHTIPGIGLITLFLLTILTGVLARNFLVKRLISLGNKILESIPLINKLYKALTQISEAFFSGQQNALKKPVLIEFPKKGVYSIAFITREVEGVIERVLPEEVVSVFLPTTPNPTTGYLLFVPKKDIHDVNLTIEDAVKLIISGGTVSLEEKTANSEKERV